MLLLCPHLTTLGAIGANINLISAFEQLFSKCTISAARPNFFETALFQVAHFMFGFFL